MDELSLDRAFSPRFTTCVTKRSFRKERLKIRCSRRTFFQRFVSSPHKEVSLRGVLAPPKFSVIREEGPICRYA
jgi:hypothetical protein